ncbi:hypothetical protein FIV42_00635 [Persicimonas caeni]|uniref:Uncharacterized protein n=1 Tax=Persicimonas caeni TaxID=2292766 RepID=A0A4Y6PM13_PERCE|nr:hypothetical protein [Persicimonas caeni]QDG49290.1 hypothetical protein FIV42_00635 [Persicimonas caeni]QED30511.1 hypothetical protein FRD00_00630 [Persicimonas caeni]
MSDLERRVQGLERRDESHAERLRTVEQALVSLAELPDRIDRLADRFDDVIRLDERVSRLESDGHATRADIDILETKVDDLALKLAKWAGGIVAAMAALQFLLKFAGG